MSQRIQNDQRRLRGSLSYHAGRAAEGAVAQDYARRGQPITAERWRCAWGEIDLIARNGDEIVFIEVKQSRSHDEALSHVTQRQVDRIAAAAAVFLDGEPRGSLTPVRFDVALVDGQGRVKVMENFLAA